MSVMKHTPHVRAVKNLGLDLIKCSAFPSRILLVELISRISEQQYDDLSGQLCQVRCRTAVASLHRCPARFKGGLLLFRHNAG